MKNHWLKLYRVHELQDRFHWTFMVGRNSIYQLTPRVVTVDQRPAAEIQSGEQVKITFSQPNTELFTWLADYYLGCQPTGHYAYLRLVDRLDQPLETWAFDKIKIEQVDFGDDKIEVAISFKSKEYRDFLRKIELYTSKSV